MNVASSTQPSEDFVPDETLLHRITRKLGIPSLTHFNYHLYRSLLTYTLQHTELVLILCTFLFGLAYLSALYPKIIGQILQNIQDQQGTSKQVQQLVQVCIMIAIITVFQKISLAMLEERVFLSLKMHFFQYLIAADQSFYDKHKLGQINSRLGVDIAQAKAAVSSSLCHFLRNSMTFLCILVALVYMAPGLSFLLLCIFSLLVFSTIIYMRVMRAMIKEYQGVTAQATATSIEAFHNIHLIKSRCTQHQEVFKMQKTFHKNWNNRKKQTVFKAIHKVITILLPNLAILVVLGLGSILVHSQVLDIGQLTTFILYSSQLATSAKGSSQSFTRIVNGTAAIQRVMEMQSYQNTIKDPEHPQPLISNSIVLQLKDVYFRYKEEGNYTLQSISLTIRARQFVAIVGPSGCGKSSLFKLLLRYYDPQKGSIWINGHPYSSYSLKQLRQAIGFVSQDSLFFAGTVRDNLTIGRQVTDNQLEQALKVAGAQFFLNRSMYPDGLDTKLVEKGANFSGGERQKLAIARAVLKKASLFLFDQPTSAQDSGSEKVIQSLLERLTRQTHPTGVVVIAHRFSTIEHADRIVLMKKGAVMMTGSGKQLQKGSQLYNRLLECELKV